jgi:hypothetical protein
MRTEAENTHSTSCGYDDISMTEFLFLALNDFDQFEQAVLASGKKHPEHGTSG